MLRTKISVMVFLLAVVLSSVTLPALGEGPKLETIYSTHSFPPLEDFTSLEDWARSNFADYLIDETIQTLDTGEYPALSFKSRSESTVGRTEFNLLIDTGDSLILLSTAPFKESPDSMPVAEVSEPGKIEPGRASSCATATNRCNCVLYARCKVPTLPYGLFTYENKVKIINAYSPTVGSVAIMKVGLPAGHVSVVTNVTKDKKGTVTSITVNEANYKSCQTTTRSGSPATLKVTGYYKPR
jgi:hypothetical protein